MVCSRGESSRYFTHTSKTMTWNDVYGTNGSDNLQGRSWQRNWFIPGYGNDTIKGSISQTDVIEFGSANNTFDLNQMFQNTGEGFKQIWWVDGAHGGDGNDRLTGHNTNGSYLYGGNGYDTLKGGSGNDHLDGGSDYDYAIFGYASNKINLNITTSQNTGEGQDTIISIENIYAGGGNDNVIGNSDSNYLYGESGNDDLGGYAGNDIIHGGSGVDTAWFSSANNRINLNSTGWQNTGDGTDRLIQIENVNAGGGNDVVTGNGAANVINAGDGNDVLNGGAGNDQLIGGSGIDTAVFSSANNRVNLNSTGWQNTGDGRDRLVQIENVNAGGGNDRITGNKGANVLNGGAGNDVLNGGGGNDQLIGGAGVDTAVFSGANNRVNLNSTAWQVTGDGRDRLLQIERVNAGAGKDVVTGNRFANVLSGGSGNDVLNGGGGNDQLIGGPGIDRLKGGLGRDTFRIQKGAGYDIIEDFRNGQDRLLLGSGKSRLRIKANSGDALIYQGSDLLARIDNAEGQIQVSGNYLI